MREKKSTVKKNDKADLYANLSKDNPKHAKIFRFIDEYGIDLNGTQAAIRAGYSPKSANEQASQLLANLSIKKLVDEKLAEIAKRNGVDQDKVIQRWQTILETDVRDFITLRVMCCRYCHSDGHLYQFTPQEFRDAQKQHEDDEKSKERIIQGYIAKEFDQQGGIGFIGTKKPNPDCPECVGEGVAKVVFKDIDSLPDAFVFKGAKVSRGNIELILADKEKALEALSRYVGLYNQSSKTTFETPDPEVLNELYRTGLESARERQRQVIAGRKLAGYCLDY